MFGVLFFNLFIFWYDMIDITGKWCNISSCEHLVMMCAQSCIWTGEEWKTKLWKEWLCEGGRCFWCQFAFVIEQNFWWHSHIKKRFAVSACKIILACFCRTTCRLIFLVDFRQKHKNISCKITQQPKEWQCIFETAILLKWSKCCSHYKPVM